MLVAIVQWAILALLPSIRASPVRTDPYDSVYGLREPQTNPLVVDLGYAIYKGYNDQNTSLNIWRGLV